MAYFANGSEGEYLDQQCDACTVGQGACPARHDQIKNETLKSAMEILIDKKGDCQMRLEIIKARP